MEGQDGNQNRHLALAHKLFLLTRPNVDGVRIRDEVIAAVKSDDMAPLYESLAAKSVVEMDNGLVESMRKRIEKEIKKIDERIADAEENLAGLTDQIKLDRYLQPHSRYYMREVRTVVYSQFLESYKGVTMDAKASAFGGTADFIDLELSRFIAAGALHGKIDKVAGVLETNRPDTKSTLYQAIIKQGDSHLNKIHKLLSHVIDL